MKKDRLFDMLGQIDDTYVQSAWRRLEDVSGEKETTWRFLPRKFPLTAAILAAFLILASSFTVAMAASEEFRNAVITFFHLGETEEVPPLESSFSGSPEIGETVIDKTVKAQYIQMNGYFTYTEDNLLYQYESEAAESDSRPVRFWAIENGEAKEAEITLEKCPLSVKWNGAVYQADLEWFEWNGNLHLFSESITGTHEELFLPTNLYASPIPGRTDVVLLTLGLSTQMDSSCYYMLYHLDTKETEDFLAGTDVGKLTREEDGLHDALWAEDMSSALLTCGWWGEDTIYYLNLKTGKMTEITALLEAADADDTGNGPDGTVPGGTAEYYSASYLDNHTLLITGETGDTISCWKYDTAAGDLVSILTDEPLYDSMSEHPQGVKLLGSQSSYCMKIDADGATQVLHLSTGETASIENFTFSPDGGILASRAGDKLLYYISSRSEDGMRVFSQLGVLDLGKGTFTAFDRMREDDGVVEYSLYWLDDSRVAIEGTTGHRETCCLYLYEF